MGRYKLTPVGAVALVAFVGGLLLLILGSTTVIQIIGLIIALCALLPVFGGMTGSQRMAGWARPQMDHDIARMGTPVPEPPPEYVEENPEAPEDVWEHERQLYHEKEEREEREREEREHQEHSEPQP